MLKISHSVLTNSAVRVLGELHNKVNRVASYEEKVAVAHDLWMTKRSTKEQRNAFKDIRTALEQMCVGFARCTYCEDSLADEIEHIKPKSLFPDLTFSWNNYCFACGPCNGPKSNRYGVILAGQLNEFFRKKMNPLCLRPKVSLR